VSPIKGRPDCGRFTLPRDRPLSAALFGAGPVNDVHQRVIEEETAMLAEFIRTQGQAVQELLDHAQQVRTRAKAAIEVSRQLKAKIAARRAAVRPRREPS
jgi:hypothetical protein